MLTQKELKDILDYNPNTGEFRWIARTPHSRVTIGSIAGSREGTGYRIISIFNKSYACHRIAWLYVVGRFPHQQIDHINGIRDDNRWINLREASPSQNRRNAISKRQNIAGVRGVRPDNKGWSAIIRHHRKSIFIGTFANKLDAVIAYNYHLAYLGGEFAILSKHPEGLVYSHD